MKTHHDRIEKKPDVMLGKPVIRGTRIPVELIIRKLGEGSSIEYLLDAYPKETSRSRLGKKKRLARKKS